MVYDSRRQRIILFGGCSNAAISGDVWEWDGTDWTKIGLPGPTARMFHGMAFDSNRGVAVLFGGTNGAVDLQETWEYRGP
jgi:hypothetical protein